MQINKIYYKIFTIAMAVLLMVSCEKEIEFKGSEVKPMMVVNGLVTPDSTIKVHLSKSKFFLSNKEGIELIPNADIDIYINGEAKGKMQYKEFGEYNKSGIYTSSVRPNINDTVKLIVANTDNIEGVQAEVVVPKQSVILSVDTVSQTTQYEVEIYEFDGENYVPSKAYNYSKKLMVSITIDDPPLVENFYRLNARTRSQLHYPDTTYVWEEYEYFYPESSDNPSGGLLGFIEDFNMARKNYTFTDEFYDGKKIILKFETTMYSWSDNTYPGNNEYGGENSQPVGLQDPDSRSKQLIVNLQSISKEMYLYFKTKESAEDVFETFFTEPVQIYSNVENGTGVLGAYTSHEIIIDLP
jgi:hypothetical protein